MAKINTGRKTEEYESYVYMNLIVLVLMFVTNDLAAIKGPLKYLLMPLLGKNQLAITLHMYASLGPNLDNTQRGQI